MSPSVIVVPAHWFNGWFLRLFARPVILVDGAEHEARWAWPTEIPVAYGSHAVAVGVRYRGAQTITGLAESSIAVASEQPIVLEARNGFFNHQPFTVTERVRTRN